MAAHANLGPRWKKSFEVLSRSRLALPTMSLSPPSDRHRFPPKELLETKKHRLVAEWDAMQPPPNSALVAMAHRIGIAGIFSGPRASGSKAAVTSGTSSTISTFFSINKLLTFVSRGWSNGSHSPTSMHSWFVCSTTRANVSQWITPSNEWNAGFHGKLPSWSVRDRTPQLKLPSSTNPGIKGCYKCLRRPSNVCKRGSGNRCCDTGSMAAKSTSQSYISLSSRMCLISVAPSFFK